ncbi:aldo-keto reductase family 1 member D1-like [Hoplias malabaricus]|uniref:aldo-keto reductase family 1 member D1-like n=1 Tax=Hoplias malabaricus TaxID=27720 RepID=UPI003462F54C
MSQVISSTQKIKMANTFTIRQTCVLHGRVNLKCPPLLEDEDLVSTGKKYKKNAAQVALRYSVQREIVVIPRSFSPQHIRENSQVSL